MDLPLNDVGRKLEHEYLAALLAFREGLISPDELSEAVGEVLEGRGTSLLEVLRERHNLTLEQLHEVHEQAKLCSEMLAAKLRFERVKTKAGGNNANLPPAVFFDEQDQAHYYESARHPTNNLVPLPTSRERRARTGQELSLTPASDTIGDADERPHRVAWVDPKQILPPDDELDNEIPEEDFEWRPTSELLSHVYLIEDSLRSFTGGMLGITGTLGLMLCFGIAIWGAFQYDLLNRFVDPESFSVAQQNDPLSSDADNAGLTEGGLPIVLAPNQDSQLEQGGQLDSAATEQDIEAVATVAEVLASAPADNEKDDDLVPPLTAEATLTPSTMVINAELEIERQVILAGQDLSRADYDLAFSRVETLITSRAPALDLKIDSRWLVLGASLLINKQTDEARLRAMEWIKPLLKSEHAQARLVCAVWLLEASPEQLDSFEQQVQADVGNDASAEVINWLFAARGDNDEVIDAIEAKLQQQQSVDPLNYLFLSLANYHAGRRVPALERLRQAAPLLNNATHWLGSATEPESEWSRKAMLQRVFQKARELKSKVETPKVN